MENCTYCGLFQHNLHAKSCSLNPEPPRMALRTYPTLTFPELHRRFFDSIHRNDVKPPQAKPLS
jgi:hypothetical protein